MKNLYSKSACIPIPPIVMCFCPLHSYSGLTGAVAFALALVRISEEPELERPHNDELSKELKLRQSMLTAVTALVLFTVFVQVRHDSPSFVRLSPSLPPSLPPSFLSLPASFLSLPPSFSICYFSVRAQISCIYAHPCLHDVEL